MTKIESKGAGRKRPNCPKLKLTFKMYKPLREDNQQGGVNTPVATVTNLEKGKARFLFLN